MQRTHAHYQHCLIERIREIRQNGVQASSQDQQGTAKQDRFGLMRNAFTKDELKFILIDSLKSSETKFYQANIDF
jgi:uncharacterized protein (UPF0305 family)